MFNRVNKTKYKKFEMADIIPKNTESYCAVDLANEPKNYPLNEQTPEIYNLLSCCK